MIMKMQLNITLKYLIMNILTIKKKLSKCEKMI